MPRVVREHAPAAGPATPTAPSPPPARTLVWARPDQAALLRRVGELAHLAFFAAGSPDAARAGHVAAELGANLATDLRAALASTDADLVLLADPGSFGGGGGEDDAAAIVAARLRGVTIASLEPIPPTALDMSGIWTQPRAGGAAIEAVRPAALPRRCLLSHALGDALAQFGPARSLAIQVLLPSAAGSLGAALVGGIDLVLALLGEPESIDAAYVGPGAGTALRALPGQTLRALDGDLAAMARLPDGRAASLLASNRAGGWACSATIMGEGGVIAANDAGFTWSGADGAVVDRHEVGPTDAAGAIAGQLRRLLGAAAPEEAPVDLPTVLTIAQAALLSARTGQAESPQTIQRLVARR